jgi:hypothetical protein
MMSLKVIFTKAAFEAAWYGIKLTAMLFGAVFLLGLSVVIAREWPAVGCLMMFCAFAGVLAYFRYHGDI